MTRSTVAVVLAAGKGTRMRSRRAKVLHELGDDLARNHEGLRFNVDAVDHGTLPRFELKAKRLVDERRLG